MSTVPGFDDQILIRLTHEDIRVIKSHGQPDAEFLAALENAKPAEDGLLVGCRRECLVDINCVLFAAGEEISDDAEIEAIRGTFEKIEAYEFE